MLIFHWDEKFPVKYLPQPINLQGILKNRNSMCQFNIWNSL